MKCEIYGLVKFKTCDKICGCIDLYVKGNKAYLSDFGEMSDFAPENADDYGCGDMGFNPYKSTHEVLDKYSLTDDEYGEICDFFR